MAARKKEKNLSMEEMLEQVQEIIAQLQAGELSFEENMEKYQKGVQLLKECSNKMETAEKELIILEVDEA